MPDRCSDKTGDHAIPCKSGNAISTPSASRPPSSSSAVGEEDTDRSARIVKLLMASADCTGNLQRYRQAAAISRVDVPSTSSVQSRRSASVPCVSASRSPSLSKIAPRAEGRIGLGMKMILDRQPPELLVLDQLDLDQVERNDREPAGEQNQNPDGARAVLHG